MRTKLQASASIVGLLLLAHDSAAQQRPDFSGTWKLIQAESRMVEGGEVRRPSLEISWLVDHREPHIAVIVSVPSADGPHDYAFRCTTDGKPCVVELSELREVRNISARWLGDRLLMTQKATTQAGPFEAVDTLSLSAAGERLVFNREVTDQRGTRAIRQTFRRIARHPPPPPAAPPLTLDSLPPTVTLPAELARVVSDYEAAYPRGGAAIAQLFTTDGLVLAAERLPIRGRVAIAEYYGESRGPLALRPFGFGIDGKTAFILGGYAARDGEPDGGKFTLTLRRAEDGRWLIASDMDNINFRLPRPPRPAGPR